MPFGRLSPVSETDTESLSSVRTTSVDLRPKPLNFSRPKPQDLPSSRNVQHDKHYANSTSSSSTNAGSSIRDNTAYNDSLPDEPQFDDDDQRFSLESERSTNPSSIHSELVWDPSASELRSKPQFTRRGSDFDAQRSEAPRRPPNNRFHPTSSSTATTDFHQPLIAELPGDRPPTSTSTSTVKPQTPHQQQKQPQQLPNPFSQLRIHTNHPQQTPLDPGEKSPHILKRTSVDQKSERLSISSIHTLNQPRPSAPRQGSAGTVGWEDTRSARSLSDAGSGETAQPQHGARTSHESGASSKIDVSQLGEKKLAKLRKKGINPELYLEMKAARGGKSRLVGPLVGNTYIG